MAEKNKPTRKGRRDSKDSRNSRRREEREPVDVRGNWKPITVVGKKVKGGEITDIDQLFDAGLLILEAEVVDALLPGLEEDLLLIGQAKGKFGGGQRRIFRQTQKKTKEGNSIQFTTCAVVGNRNGYVGISTGKSKETVPARDKAKRKARLNLMRIRRGCGSWETDSREPNSIPFAVTGRCGSVRLTLMPAPPGKGLCVEKECAKILALAGIKDIWSRTEGQTKVKLNMISALINALKKLSEMKIRPGDVAKLGIIDGKAKEVGVSEKIQTSEEIEAEMNEGKKLVANEFVVEKLVMRASVAEELAEEVAEEVEVPREV